MTQPKNNKKFFLTMMGALIGLALVLGIGISVWISQQMKPLNVNAEQTVRFVIPKGQSIRRISERLQEEGLVRSSLGFRWAVWKNKLTTKIQAGSFELSPNLSVESIAKKLTVGTNDMKVTIPEGKRIEEVAEYFSDFEEFDAEAFIALAKDEEGYLFPDTYLFPTQATAETVHSLLRKTFDEVAEKNQFEQKAQKIGYSFEEIVTLASILEREAQSAEDMKIVAGILYNRLKAGMPLQVDATMQYAKGYDKVKKDWWSPPLAADKKIDSPYNTYAHPGLPPGPISNPGLKALEAAVLPTTSEYYYYITDNNGAMHYSETYEEHLVNIEKYLR